MYKGINRNNLFGKKLKCEYLTFVDGENNLHAVHYIPSVP